MLFYLSSAVLAVAVIAVWYLVDLVLRTRNQLNGFPQPPMKNRLLGHLHIAADCARLLPPDAHVQHVARYIQKKYNLGDYFYVDWWPLGPRWLFISDPDIISNYITGSQQSLPKSKLLTDFLSDFLGEYNMVGVEGQYWKSLRSMFNPGFSASHLMTLVPYVVNASLVFSEILAKNSNNGQLVELEELATMLTIDIIGKVVLDLDFNSQKTTHPIVRCFRKRIGLMPFHNALFDLTRFEFRRRWRLWQNGRQLDHLIGIEVDKKLDEGYISSGKKKRSVVDLALAAYKKEQSHSKDAASKSKQNERFRSATIDSIKTFIFAGHDTSASTIAYALYLLHFSPEVHKRIVSELRSVFEDISRDSMAKAMKEDPYIINRLEYLTAVIKEVLRLFPPVSTMRAAPTGSGLMMIDHKTGKKMPLSGFESWPAAVFTGRNEKFFPEPVKFIPERFIPTKTPFPEAKLFTPAGKEAWRAFERGPRSCIGQELAMIELKVTLALTVTEFDFVAEFDGEKIENWVPIETCDEFQDGVDGKIRRTVEGHACYQILKGAAKPRDSMPGRVISR